MWYARVYGSVSVMYILESLHLSIAFLIRTANHTLTSLPVLALTQDGRFRLSCDDGTRCVLGDETRRSGLRMYSSLLVLC